MKLLRKLMVGLALVSPLAMPLPAAADPSNPVMCGCVYIATGFNPGTGQFTYGWVCPSNPTCMDEVS
jgi:hypothetical protein